ncbi:PREDICTED: uncharacterized protein LOC105364049, partial [Ceratosolen solmsi marchali]|uniref:Uncharacterized protein LOC105364049 n=1 Tax=Ceratosolen solmsi marchali TaxID=326594 RepID=A0AAJ7DXN9_9HYME
STGRKSHGFHLIRSKWDPYPWIKSVDKGSSADVSGLRSGDCLLEIDGRDVLGLEMKDIAYLIGKNDRVNLGLWRRPPKLNSQAVNETLLDGPLPEVAQKLVKAVSGVVKALECPVCLDSAAPPVSQCVHGHLLCFGCRLKTTRCPVCRVRLGQGRCLLADKSHRILTEALVNVERSVVEDDRTNAMPRSLHDSIFGPPSRTKKRKSSIASRKTKDFVSKIFSSSKQDEMSVSTESLPTTSCVMDGNLLYGRRWLLRLYDRRKSASTGELSRGNSHHDDDRAVNGSFTELHNYSQETVKSGSLLSVPQTPMWGGSTESMTTGRLNCPFKERAEKCGETINYHTLMEHLSFQHSGPLIHFYKKTITLPVPLPFQEDAVYILHHKDENFILLNENNKIWISSSEINCALNWEWIVHAVSDDKAEVHLRQEIYSLRDSFELSSRHIATLPKNISISSVTISLIELNLNGGTLDCL